MCFSAPNPKNCSCPLSYLLTFPILCFALLCPPSTPVTTATALASLRLWRWGNYGNDTAFPELDLWGQNNPFNQLNLWLKKKLQNAEK